MASRSGNAAAGDFGSILTATIGFEENKGQVLTTDGDPAPFVRFVLASGNAKIFLLENGIAYQFERMHYPEGYSELLADKRSAAFEHEGLEAMHAQVQRETFRMDMELVGADPQARISTEGRSQDYTNYYNRDVLDVHHYSKITYHDVYPGIDWEIYTTATGMKYDFVVHPGADPDMIRLRFEHQEELYLNDTGNLIHGNRLGRFTEQRPVSFQGNVEVASAFILNRNILRFGLGAYDRSKALIIDPDRIWGTYYGGTSHENTAICTTDGNNNVYLAGSTASISDIASVGFQNNYNGEWDAFLVKFDGDGLREWSTYYGGSDFEVGSACVVDGSGNVYLVGTTGSTTAISFQGHQNMIGGNRDAFLVKFNASGVRQWCTYYGGTLADSGFSCSVDENGQVYMAGRTWSSMAIASGGHQNTHGGYVDAFLTKFNCNGVLQWGTYYGGPEFDDGFACAVDGSGNVFLSGWTRSVTAISYLGHQDMYGGDADLLNGSDAFLVKFNASGVRQWATYYGGNDKDIGYSCAVDSMGNVYLAGLTLSTAAIASGGHQNTHGGGYDGFLVRFNGSGSRLWSTYYGGAEYDHLNSVSVSQDNVFIGGITNSLSAIASGGFQNIYGGGTHDGFLVAMKSDGERQWATYYGGPDDDQGHECSIDAIGSVYLAGFTHSTSAIAYNGHQNTYGGERDGFLVKFKGDLSTGISISEGRSVAVGIQLHPNPARDGWFTLTLDDPALTENTSAVIELFDALGKRMYSERATVLGGELNHVLHFGKDLEAGVYSVMVSFGDVRVQRSLVVE